MSAQEEVDQGPDLTNTLAGVFCRFHQETVTFISDIKGMFHQVKANAEHRDYLRFLWWTDGDTSKNADEYRSEVKELDLDHDVLPMDRVLGVQWCVETDDSNSASR